MATRPTADLKPAKKPWLKDFSKAATLRSLVCYAICSWLEIALMTVRTSEETQVLVGLADDLLSKMTVLLAASFLFGFSFIVFRWKGVPSAVKRFLHMVVAFLPVVMISQSLVNDTNLDTQAFVAYYFFALLVYLAVYGICMVVSHFLRREV
ncbi:MAG: hypothetical protein IJW34_09835 [Clostridia bacterium]|nr:hypothetical protein [Clostridia bacterium]